METHTHSQEKAPWIPSDTGPANENAMTSVTVTMPNLPWSKLGPNGRLHPIAKNTLVQSAIEAMLAELVSQDAIQAPNWERAHLDITYVASDKRRRDLDNLIACTKPWIDGLVGTVIKDDSADRLELSARYEIGDEAKTIMKVSML